MSGALADYERLFWRERPWRFVADEEHAGDARVDLVFASSSAIEFDEVKVATGLRRFDEAEILAQAARLADSGVASYGSEFSAVRVVLLESRPRSCRVKPGDLEPGAWALAP